MALVGLMVLLISTTIASGFTLLILDAVMAITAGIGLLIHLTERKEGHAKLTTFFAKYNANLQLLLASIGAGVSVLTVLGHGASGAYDA